MRVTAPKYTDHNSALEYFPIDTLYDRRQKHMLKFSLKCTYDIHNKKIFPKNVNMRGKDVFHVNFARTSQYMNSAVPQCQRMLNRHVKNEQ